MNVDAALVARVLDEEYPVARQARTIAKLAGLPLDRTRGALTLLKAVDKAETTSDGLWKKATV